MTDVVTLAALIASTIIVVWLLRAERRRRLRGTPPALRIPIPPYGSRRRERMDTDERRRRDDATGPSATMLDDDNRPSRRPLFTACSGCSAATRAAVAVGPLGTEEVVTVMEEATPGAGAVTVARRRERLKRIPDTGTSSEPIPVSAPSTSTGSRRGHSPPLDCITWFTAPDSSRKGIEAQPAFAPPPGPRWLGVDPRRDYRLITGAV